jgi:ABC-type spermidine/putrescine transport system permease subunit I
MTRALAVFYIMLCFSMGVVLLFSPWLPSWMGNFFVHHYAWVKELARNDYVRGAVSGLGLADLGLGAYETGVYRRRARKGEAMPHITI